MTKSNPSKPINFSYLQIQTLLPYQNSYFHFLQKLSPEQNRCTKCGLKISKLYKFLKLFFSKTFEISRMWGHEIGGMIWKPFLSCSKFRSHSFLHATFPSLYSEISHSSQLLLVIRFINFSTILVY